MYNQNQPQYQPAQQAALAQQPVQRKTQIIYDEEVKEIFESTYPEMVSALVNIAVKKYAKSSEFKNYFLRKDLRSQKDIEEEIEEEEIIDNFNKPSGTSQQQAPVSTAPSAVSAW